MQKNPKSPTRNEGLVIGVTRDREKDRKIEREGKNKKKGEGKK
jgi:hypothetical protein